MAKVVKKYFWTPDFEIIEYDDGKVGIYNYINENGIIMTNSEFDKWKEQFNYGFKKEERDRHIKYEEEQARKTQEAER